MPEQRTGASYNELENDFSVPDVTPVGVDMTPQELKDRRRLLGPEVDISHPEFGRRNRPEETYRTEHQVEIIPDKHGGTAIRSINRIYDYTGRLVDEKTDISTLTQLSSDAY